MLELTAWEGLTPAEVAVVLGVPPSRYGPTVDEVLADVPLPPGIDLDALRSGPLVVLSRDTGDRGDRRRGVRLGGRVAAGAGDR